MMDDGVKEKGRDEDVKVQDIAELLIEAIEAGERACPGDPRKVPARASAVKVDQYRRKHRDDVVVGEPRGLHERVDGRGADEPEAALLKVPAKGSSPRRRSRRSPVEGRGWLTIGAPSTKRPRSPNVPSSGFLYRTAAR